MKKLPLLAFALIALGCSATDTAARGGTQPAAGGSAGVGGTDAGVSLGGGGSGGTIPVDLDSGVNGDASWFVGDPKTCAEAASSKSYVGCDFWPTVTANSVWEIFDFTVVVANTQDTAASVSIERGGNVVAEGTVEPNSLGKFYLPWVPELKGPAVNECGYLNQVLNTSVRAPGGAYHLTTSVPVTVYQFNALEYKPAGGPPGKDWSSCPGNSCPGGTCLSYSNDASLLLPSTVLTGNYRITGMRGWEYGMIPPYFTVTGTANDTHVTVKVAGGGQVSAGNGVSVTGGDGVLEFPIQRGEVVQIVATPTTDLSGSLLQADKPVQVISGMACVYLPFSNKACDHIEETVFPAETLGKHYFVTRPTGPNSDTPGHIVRIYGNVNGTKLTYSPVKPPNAPETLQAGDVFDLDIVTQDFEVSGDHEFSVAAFQLGATIVDPNTPYNLQKGDPSQTLFTAVEQYRKKYVFLAPDDYDVSFVDIVLPDGAKLELDGVAITPAITPIASGHSVARVQLGPGQSGNHVLTSSEPVGIQVMGYGLQTSYQYPGGSNLLAIAPPPPPIK